MSKGLEMLENKELKIKSVELVDIINQFRQLEDNRSELRHNDFMTKIRKEIETLEKVNISTQRNFSQSSYINSQNKVQPCFELSRDGMLQMLNSESALVRYKTIEYINKLEEDLANNRLLIESSQLAIAHKEIEEYRNIVEKFKSSTDKAMELYKPSHKRKLDYNKLIKYLSGNKEDAEEIKNYVFIALNIDKWEETNIGQHERIVDLIQTGAKIIAINKITLV